MKIGMVDLYVDLNGINAEDRFSAIQQGIVRDSSRSKTVLRAANAAAAAGCDIIVFPGWTVVANQPPAALKRASEGRTIVMECVPRSVGRGPSASPKGQRTLKVRGFVLHDGRIAVGPTLQELAWARQVWEDGARTELSEGGLELAAQAISRAPQGRRWRHPELGETMLLLCGEANFVGGRGTTCYNADAFKAEGLTAKLLRSVKIFLNPSHAPGGPQAIRDKRAWLSKGGSVLVNTANAHSDGYTIVGTAGGRTVGKKRLNGISKIWKNGKNADPKREWEAGDLIHDGFQVWSFPVRHRSH